MLVVQSTNFSNLKERVESIRQRQANLEEVNRDLLRAQARFDALQVDVREELQKIDRRLESIENKL